MSTAPRQPSALELLFQSDTPGRQITRGWVSDVDVDGTVHVHTRRDEDDASLPCDRLVVADGAELRLARGDVVLFLEPSARDGRGIVLGRVGPSNAPETKDIPDELVLEAKEQLTLRVGDGSITLRADGKIQIKGKDLISHAQRLNRIKGGAVSIN